MERRTAAQAGEQEPPSPDCPFLLVEMDSLLSLEPWLNQHTQASKHTPEQQEARLGGSPHNPKPCLPAFPV